MVLMKIIYPFLLIIFLSFFGIESNGQFSEGGIPLSFLLDSLPVSFQEIYIDPPDLSLILEEDAKENKSGFAQRYGVILPVGINLHEAGTWEVSENLTRIWRLKLSSDKALALGIFFKKVHLPGGVKLFIYDEQGIQVTGAYTSNTELINKGFSSLLIRGSKIIVELNVPAGVSETPEFDISEIEYAYRYIPDFSVIKGGETSGECEVNVNCIPEGAGWDDEKRGIVKIRVIVNKSTFNCSGSLVNNTRFDFTPYVLTADHCAYQNVHYAKPEDLLLWKFYFNYEYPTCDDGTLPEPFTLEGAVKTAQGGNRGLSGSDFYLVKLIHNIPVSVNAYFNGWSLAPDPTDEGVCIHHPDGDVKKISTFTESLISSSWMGNGLSSHWKVYWTETLNGWGVTEGGSSGSPLFNAEGQIVGTLTGGQASCQAPDLPDFYGKFSYHWQSNGLSDTAQLKPWLDPLNTGIQSISGVSPGIGVLSDSRDGSVKIFPNPAVTGFVLDFNVQATGSYVIEIFDLFGQKVLDINNYQINDRRQIDISALKPGIYLMKIRMDKDLIQEKLIKQ
jgi:hypothetical protein